MLFTDKEKCEAWRCQGFSCMKYIPDRLGCNMDLCHVCAESMTCRNCEYANGCSYATENIKLQEGEK